MHRSAAKLRRRAILCGWGSMVLLWYVWAVRHSRIRLMVRSTVDGAKQRGFTITVAVDQMRLIRFEVGMWLIDCVYSMEVVSRIVDVDGDTRKRRPLLVSIGQRQKCRGCEYQYKSTVRQRCERGAGADDRRCARCSVCQGSKCGEHDC